MSDSLWPHGPQHTWPPYPSPTFGVYSNSCPLSWWCHPTISSSVIPFSPCPQSFPESGSFQMSQFFASGFTHILFPFWMWNYSTFLDVEHFFKSTEFVSILLLFFFFFWLWGMWDLTSFKQGWNLYPLQWKVKSQPLDNQGSPSIAFF